MPELALWYPMIIPILLWVLELWLTAIWLPVLFRSGIPLFQQAFPSAIAGGIPLEADQLSQKFENLTYPSLLFHKVSESEYLFREAFQLRPMGYAPIIRGQIFREPHNPEIMVTGRMNWIMVLVFFLVLSTFLYAGLQVFEPRYVFAVALVVFPAAISITTGFQISRFKKVAQFISEQES